MISKIFSQDTEIDKKVQLLKNFYEFIAKNRLNEEMSNITKEIALKMEKS